MISTGNRGKSERNARPADDWLGGPDLDERVLNLSAPTRKPPTAGPIEEFVDAYLTTDAEADVPKDEVHRVYAIWAARRGHEVQNKVWLSRRLSEIVDLDTSRRRVDGDRINFYTGIELTPAARELIE